MFFTGVILLATFLSFAPVSHRRFLFLNVPQKTHWLRGYVQTRMDDNALCTVSQVRLQCHEWDTGVHTCTGVLFFFLLWNWAMSTKWVLNSRNSLNWPHMYLINTTFLANKSPPRSSFTNWASQKTTGSAVICGFVAKLNRRSASVNLLNVEGNFEGLSYLGIFFVSAWALTGGWDVC